MLGKKTVLLTIVLVLCLQLLLPAMSALAEMETFSLVDLAYGASSIVRGQVVSVSSQWNADHTNIFTTVTIAVQSYIKGSGEKEITFQIPGGEVGEIGEWVEHVPAFAEGEEVVLFLQEGDFPILGWEQGKFTIVDDLVLESGLLSADAFIGQIRDILGYPPEAPDLHPERPVAVSLLAPSITSVSPTSGRAGVNLHVTINGNNFGATQGTSTVKLWWGGSTTWTTVSGSNIVSWSNTQIVIHLVAPASSHSTQAIKVTVGGSNAYAGFTVKWAKKSYKWPGTCTCVKYYVYANTSDCTGEADAVRKGAWAWNNADYHCHHLSYFGSTTRSAPTNDGYNVVRWGDLAAGILAQCTTWYAGSDIVEFDIVFNDDYNWSTADTCPAGRYDVWDIATHELGHGGVGLYDLYGTPDSEKTMYGYGASCETKKRTLHSDDIDAIQYIY